MKTLTRIEACQVLLDGGKLEYSHVDSDYWSDVTNRDLVFTLNEDYLFRQPPEYKYIEYTLDGLAAHLKTSDHKEVWIVDTYKGFVKESITHLDKDKIAIRAFSGDKFYKRVEPE